MHHHRWSALCAAAALTIAAPLVLAPAASASVPVSTIAPESAAAPRYLLSLGDSLGFGYSDANLAEFVRNENPADFAGYTQDVAAALHLGTAVTNLSCPGETTTSMIDGPCPAATEFAAITGRPWPYAKQLTAATAFLAAHRSERGVVLLSIGANDALDLLQSSPQCATNASCPELAPMLRTLGGNLTTILRHLRAAAPRATFVVLAPYNPLGEVVPASNVAAVILDATIALTAWWNGAHVADGFGAINVAHRGDFDCGTLVYYCGAATPTDPYPSDVHPTAAGYAVLSSAFLRALR